MADVTVSLNVNNNPAVSCEPPQCVVDHGNHDITWKHGGSTDFTFQSITGLPTSIFTTPQADAPSHPDWFICGDNNQQAEEDPHPYTVTVLGPNGQQYSTNKTTGGGGQTVPCIKNN